MFYTNTCSPVKSLDVEDEMGPPARLRPLEDETVVGDGLDERTRIGSATLHDGREGGLACVDRVHLLRYEVRRLREEDELVQPCDEQPRAVGRLELHLVMGRDAFAFAVSTDELRERRERLREEVRLRLRLELELDLARVLDETAQARPYPFTTPSGRRRATRLARPACSTTRTTRSTSL
jgi:hypothetical protein